MHDINFIRTNPVEFDNRIKLRGVEHCAEKVNKIDEERRNTQTVLQNILAERNILSKKVGEIKSKKEDASVIIKKVEKLKNQISSLKELEKIKEDELNAILCRIPNLPSKDVPIGDNEKDNTQYKIEQLARTSKMPQVKGFSIEVLNIKLIKNMVTSLHTYIFNYGESDVGISWDDDDSTFKKVIKRSLPVNSYDF